MTGVVLRAIVIPLLVGIGSAASAGWNRNRNFFAGMLVYLIAQIFDRRSHIE